jgi:ADP-heptose:LPS heptosyltransferase
VIVTKNHESNISRDLALISQAAIFMGMSSGPCNIAIFSDTPFIIYKNPDHDVEEMKLELGKNNRFVFSTASQKFLRIFETVENLIQEFEESYSGLIMEKSKPVTGE